MSHKHDDERREKAAAYMRAYRNGRRKDELREKSREQQRRRRARLKTELESLRTLKELVMRAVEGGKTNE